MDALEVILGRVERRLKVVGLTANAASIAAGKKDAIRNLQRAVKTGTRQGVTITTIKALAPVLRTTSSWLLEEEGPEDPESSDSLLPIWGIAGAGGQVYRFHEADQPIDRVPMPDGIAPSSTIAGVRIVGESLGRLFDGFLAVYDELRTPPTTDLYNRLCIVGLADGRVMVKLLKKGRGSRFTLESNYEAPIVNVEVTWAAKIKNIVQP